MICHHTNDQSIHNQHNPVVNRFVDLGLQFGHHGLHFGRHLNANRGEGGGDLDPPFAPSLLHEYWLTFGLRGV